MSVENRDWKGICEAVSKEYDPEKLMDLVSELLKVLDDQKPPDWQTDRN